MQVFWAVDLDCYMNDYSAHIYYFDLLMKGSFDQKTYEYNVELKDNNPNTNSNTLVVENRVFMVIPFILY